MVVYNAILYVHLELHNSTITVQLARRFSPSFLPSISTTRFRRVAFGEFFIRIINVCSNYIGSVNDELSVKLKT